MSTPADDHTLDTHEEADEEIVTLEEDLHPAEDHESEIAEEIEKMVVGDLEEDEEEEEGPDGPKPKQNPKAKDKKKKVEPDAKQKAHMIPRHLIDRELRVEDLWDDGEI